MLQRRQQCQAVRAKSTPALEAYRLVTTLAGVADIKASLDLCTHFDLTQQQSVVVVIGVKSNGLAKHVFRIRQTDGLRRPDGQERIADVAHVGHRIPVPELFQQRVARGRGDRHDPAS